MNVNIYPKSAPDTEGRHMLFFFVGVGNKRAKISTGIKCHPEAWDGKNINKTKTEVNGDKLNTLLQLRKALFFKIQSEAELNMVQLTAVQIKDSYLEKLNGVDKKYKSIEKKYTFKQMAEDYKLKYANMYSPATLRKMNQTVIMIDEFKKNISIVEIDQKFLVSYCDFLVGKGLQNTTIKTNHVKNIKVLAKEAERMKMNVSPEIAQFKWKDVAKQPFCATWEEVEGIEKIKDLEGIDLHIRDSFLVTCYTGLRDSDFRNIHPSMISKERGQYMLRVVMQKTSLDYAIPISAKLLQILKRYDYKIPTYAQQTYNEKIKHIVRPVAQGEVIKIKFVGAKRINISMPRHKMYSSHTGRRTFGKRWIDRGGSLIVLSKIFGHSSTDTTLKYIGYQPGEISEEFRRTME